MYLLGPSVGHRFLLSSTSSHHAKQKAIAAIIEAAPAVMAVPVKRVDEVKLPPPSPPLLELSAFHEISTGPIDQLALEVEVGFQMAPNSTLAPLVAISAIPAPGSPAGLKVLV